MASAYGAQRAITFGWKQLTQFSPSHFEAPRPTTGTAALSSRVVLILLDGLRPEDAPYLPQLELLRRKGSDFDLTVPSPVYGAPALATLLTGSVPTVHGVVLDAPPQQLAADSLTLAAGRVKGSTGAVGNGTLGALLGSGVGQWETVSSPEQAVQVARQLAGASGPKLAIVQLDDLHRGAHELKEASRDSAEYRNLLAGLDAQLVQILEQVDLKKTAVLVTGVLPVDRQAGHPTNGRVPLVMAGPGIKEGMHGTATLQDVAPTVSVLLGAPVPLQSQGKPLVEALQVEGRPADAISQRYLSVRKTYADAALQSLGSLNLAPDAPGTAAEAAAYLQQVEQQVKTARWEVWKQQVLDRLPYIGGGLLVVLLYLILAFRQPFSFALFMGTLTYASAFHLIFFASGGSYSPSLAGLEGFSGNLAAGLGLRTAVAMSLAAMVTGLLLSRREFKRPVYVTRAALHALLVTSALGALPVAVGVLVVGWQFPVELPAPGLLIWFFVTGIQLVVIGYMSPIWVGLSLISFRIFRHFWPLKEVGDPERNADKVVRMRSLRRSART